MGRLEGKVAIVTGAGSGMGKASALLFAEEGARVVCADRSGKEKDTADAIGDGAIAVHADVSVTTDVAGMVEAAETTFGKLDVLYNNAGFGGPRHPLAEQTEETWDTVHGTNLRGVFLGMKYGILAMLRNGGGSVITTASVAGLRGWKHHSVYGAAKAGVIHLTRAVALDYAEHNIRVNCICPGSFWTGLVPMSAEIPLPPPDARPPGNVPINRWGLPSEIAAAALFLASDESLFITGVALPVDGGFAAG
jgi:NAD(P)-dependent dehydrogenase (short-subunit alcohol dehydrogenase family)